MKNKDFKIYKEGHLEGYKIGLRDMANYERRFKLEEYKNRTIFLLVLITGIGNI
jgi:predicted transcriptional regulator